MDEFFAYLEAIAPLESDLIAHLRTILKVRNYPKDTFLVQPGYINDRFFFIVGGMVRCYWIDGKTEISKWFLGENNVIASAWSYENQLPGLEYMEAFRDCRVAYGTFKDLEETYTKFASFNRHGRVVAQRYNRIFSSICDALRYQDAGKRYAFLVRAFPDLLQAVPAKYLASFMGMSEVTLSRVRSRR